jgi:hypothetical protein
MKIRFFTHLGPEAVSRPVREGFSNKKIIKGFEVQFDGAPVWTGECFIQTAW